MTHDDIVCQTNCYRHSWLFVASSLARKVIASSSDIIYKKAARLKWFVFQSPRSTSCQMIWYLSIGTFPPEETVFCFISIEKSNDIILTFMLKEILQFHLNARGYLCNLQICRLYPPQCSMLTSTLQLSVFMQVSTGPCGTCWWSQVCSGRPLCHCLRCYVTDCAWP